MVAAMRAADTGVIENPASASRKVYGRIVIVGGGCYGSYYLRQLIKGRSAGAISWDRITIVDREAECAAASAKELFDDTIEVIIAEWSKFFDEYLTGLESALDAGIADAIVPSPLMPHLMYEWLLDRARRRWPARSVATKKFDLPAEFPWSRAVEDGTQYVSYATWTCPINCIEPRTCPHTRGPRNWSIPRALAEGSSSAAGLKGTVIFHCTHRAYGVGMIDAAEVVEADRLIAERCASGGEVLIGTASHCHGALNVLSISS